MKHANAEETIGICALSNVRWLVRFTILGKREIFFCPLFPSQKNPSRIMQIALRQLNEHVEKEPIFESSTFWRRLRFCRGLFFSRKKTTTPSKKAAAAAELPLLLLKQRNMQNQ